MRTRSPRLRAAALSLLVIPCVVLAALPVAADPGTDPDSGEQHAVAVEIDHQTSDDSLGTSDEAKILAPALQDAADADPTESVQVTVVLSEDPIAAVIPENAVDDGTLPPVSEQRAVTAGVVEQQDALVDAAADLGASELGRASQAANVVALELPAGALAELAHLPGVRSVKPLNTYRTQPRQAVSGSLAQAAAYVEATSLRRAGITGRGVRVAVLDSGIDFTHADFAGPGTVAAYQNCYEGADGRAYDRAPTGSCAKFFGGRAPAVKGGYDFVGESWTGASGGPALAPDPNPIDNEGHGTHVADILGGRSANGKHLGIAPGVDLYAVKICSALTSSCSGAAMLEGFDWALDPNGDGNLSDAVDVVNMSVGTAYGQELDDAVPAIENLVRAGIVAVTTAGNEANRPFNVSSPSIATGVISVGQSALPDDVLYRLGVTTVTGPAAPIGVAVPQPWAPRPSAVLDGTLARPVVTTGCTAESFAGFPAGSIALIARGGGCSGSEKAAFAQAAGATAVLIYNNVPGEAPSFSYGGGGDITVPTLTVSMPDGQRLITAMAAGPVTVTIDPSTALSLTNTMVASSSRGTAIGTHRGKPDIVAPGAWTSAQVGTGSGQTSFGGTSGSAPVVAAAAALMLDIDHRATPTAIKARLMNAADTGNQTVSAAGSLYPTPIARAGAGELRVAPAVRSGGVLRAADDARVLGFGLTHVAAPTKTRTNLRLTNSTWCFKVYRLSVGYRDAADAARGGVTLDVPAYVVVGPRSSVTVPVTMSVDPAKLAAWPFTYSAGMTGDGSLLDGPEYDGYLTAVAGSERLTLPWTVLPQRSASVTADPEVALVGGTGSLNLVNAAATQAGDVDVYGLTGTSPQLPTPGPGEPGSVGSNQAIIDLAAVGVRDIVASDYIEFAIAGYQRQTVPLYPAGYEVDIDTNNDGRWDYALWHQELDGFAESGESVAILKNLATGVTRSRYYVVADFDSATIGLPARLSDMGLTTGSRFTFGVAAYDNYFSGRTTDQVTAMRWTVGQRKYAVTGGSSRVVSAGGTLTLGVTTPTTPVTSTETGLLLFYGNAAARDFQVVPATVVTPPPTTSTSTPPTTTTGGTEPTSTEPTSTEPTSTEPTSTEPPATTTEPPTSTESTAASTAPSTGQSTTPTKVWTTVALPEQDPPSGSLPTESGAAADAGSDDAEAAAVDGDAYEG